MILSIDNFIGDMFVKHKDNVLISRGLDLSTKIARYMNIDYLYDLLCGGKRFRVYNRSCFSDLSETKDYGTHGFNVFHIVSNKTPDELKRECDLCGELKKNCKNMCVWCWSKDIINKNGDNECAERYLMWKAYTDGVIGCRIETTIGKLIESFDDNYDYVIGEVSYGDRNDKRVEDEHSVTAWELFTKNHYYADEQEVRLVVLSKQKEDYIECVNLQCLLTKITISPFIPQEIVKEIVFVRKYRLFIFLLSDNKMI